jgi:flagellar protein FlbD
MILITRLNGSKFYINAEKVISVEGTPDTIITLINNVKYVVKEKPEEVVNEIINYHRKINNPQITMEKEK